MTRSVAGPVEFEVQKSANTLRDILKELQVRRSLILTRLSDYGSIPTAYVDAILARDQSIATGSIYSGFDGRVR
jgi:mannitol/fructose-specific phosphotransferase system IIA component